MPSRTRERGARYDNRKLASVMPPPPEQIKKLPFATALDIATLIRHETGVLIAPATIVNWPVRRKTPHRRCLLLSVPDVLSIVERQLRNAPIVKG